MRARLVFGLVAIAIVATVGVVAAVASSGEGHDYRAVAETAARLSSRTTTIASVTTTSTTAATSTTTSAPPTTTSTTAQPTTTTAVPPPTPPSTADPARCTEGPNCVDGWNLDTCEGFLGAVQSAGRAPSSGEIQYLWIECGIDLTGDIPG